MINNYDYLFKIIFLGDSGVGKTSIINRYLYDNFILYSYTVGYNFYYKLIEYNNELIKIQLWDLSGSEHRIIDKYYKQANGSIIVYDINNRYSFNELKYWIEEIKNNAPNDIKVLLVGNKCDLSERKITKEEGEKIADVFNINFIETSAKNGYNIHKALDILIKDIFDNMNKSSIKLKSDVIIGKIDKCF